MSARKKQKGALPAVAILGGGRLGRAVAQVIVRGGAPVRLWARRELLRAQVKSELPDVVVTGSVQEAAAGAPLVLFAVPAPALTEVAAAFGEVASGDQIVLHGCRGVSGEESFLLPHAAIRRETCVKKIGALGGPLYVEDIDSGRPIAAVLGSRFDEVKAAVKELVAGTNVRLHGTRDLIGVEVAGAISNVAALAAGMSDALELGETARGVLLTHGLSEATRIGLSLGAELATFSGLAGVGDLIPRDITSTRRNERVGQLVARGTSLDDALLEVQGIVEGVTTAREARRLAERCDLELPLIAAVSDVLAGRRSAREALAEVLSQDLRLGSELSAR